MNRPPTHGWLVLDKPRGMGSTQAVGAVKRMLREGGWPKVKVGHGGTLDPLAEGVLPIALGEATKLAGRMLDARKQYAFTIAFGEETDTLDAEGAVVARSSHRPPRVALLAVLNHFTDEIEQVPPAYSALKVDGKRAHARARAGEDVKMTPRRVTVYSLEAASGAAGEDAGPLASSFATTAGRPDPYDPAAPLELLDSVTLIARVSKGTYIRSLARDIARALGTVGHVIWLRRTAAGPFGEERAIALDFAREAAMGGTLRQHLLPIEAGLDGIPALPLEAEQAEAVRQGRRLSGLPQPDGLHLATHRSVPQALIELEGGTARIVRGFNLFDTAE